MEFLLLPSIYSQRIYEFLKSWDDKPETIISVLDLHEMLNTPNSFRANFTEFRRWVLEKAHKDISKYTKLIYEWEPIKKGPKRQYGLDPKKKTILFGATRIITDQSRRQCRSVVCYGCVIFS